jgi:arylsulfatase A-like enzyme
MRNPFLTYFHLLPPHDPYGTRKEFVNRFAHDNFKTPDKTEHFMTDGKTYKQHRADRRQYDEYILYVDAEIGRLFSILEANGSLENTCVIITSDHGEMFERGIWFHLKPCMYQPLVNIPLLIMPLGQKERIDIHTPTAAIDILPTLLNIAGIEIPPWAEGMVLPPYNVEYPSDRSIYVMDAKHSEAGKPYENASLMLRKENYKLIYHFGVVREYEVLNGEQYLELYDLESDPEEMDNLFKKRPEIANQLFDEMNAKLASMNLLK